MIVRILLGAGTSTTPLVQVSRLVDIPLHDDESSALVESLAAHVRDAATCLVGQIALSGPPGPSGSEFVPLAELLGGA